MRTFLIICCLFTIGLGSEIADISAAKTANELETVYYGLNKQSKRVYFKELANKKKDTTFVFDKSLESITTKAIDDEDVFIAKEALIVSGLYRVKANKAKIVERAFKADSISPMYSAHIRQAAIKALCLLGGDSLNVTFKDMLMLRKNHWFDGDLTMILEGLYVYGDSSALDLVVSLKQRLQQYRPKDDYSQQQRQVLLSNADRVEQKLRERK